MELDAVDPSEDPFGNGNTSAEERPEKLESGALTLLFLRIF